MSDMLLTRCNPKRHCSETVPSRLPPPSKHLSARIGPTLQLLWVPLTHETRLVRETAASALAALLVMAAARPSHYAREWYRQLLETARAPLAEAKVIA